MSNIESIGVLGAGQMGSGIAQVAAASGFVVKLADASIERSTAARNKIEAGLRKQIERGKATAEDVTATLSRLTAVDGIASLSDADLVIEAVTEHLETKLKIFSEVDQTLKPGALLASNTSSISLTRLAAATSRPESVIGLHFFNPVPAMKLVEVIRALQTSDSTYYAAREIVSKLNKTVVTAKDSPGFIVNRILVPLLNEAVFALEANLGTVADIDAAAKLGLNHPMGPLELADFIGLDTVLAIAEVLQRDLGEDKYRPPTLLRTYVAAGWLGRKTGRGFYTYGAK